MGSTRVGEADERNNRCYGVSSTTANWTAVTAHGPPCTSAANQSAHSPPRPLKPSALQKQFLNESDVARGWLYFQQQGKTGAASGRIIAGLHEWQVGHHAIHLPLASAKHWV